MSIKNQKQHRIPKVYLKAFSFRDSANAIRVCLQELGNPVLKNVHIKQFTTEVNLFDSQLADEEHKRFFEEASGRAETYYPRVIDSISKSDELTKDNRDHLIRFTSNLFIRQKNNREYFMMKIFEHPHTRNKLFNEISMFHENPEESIKLWKIVSTDIPAKEQLNLFLGEIWNHFMNVFSKFEFVILKAQPGTFWFTSDNPVILDTRDNEEAWIVPPQSEIYFPLNPEYLLFMYNPRVESNTRFREYPSNQVSYVSENEQNEIIMNRIYPNAEKFLIMNVDLGRIDLRDS